MKYINTDYDLIIDKTDENFPTYTVLHTFQCIENGKHYVILTDGSTDEGECRTFMLEHLTQVKKNLIFLIWSLTRKLKWCMTF